MTLIGEGGAGSGSDVMNTRSEYYGSILNSVFTEFQGRDQTASVTNYYGTVTNNVFWSNVGGNGVVDTVNNAFVNPLLVSIDRDQNELLDPRPQAGSPLLSGAATPPNDGYFIATVYKGGLNQTLWFSDWSALTDNEHCAPTANAIVCAQPAAAAPVCPAPTLSIVLNGLNVDVSWASSAGCNYQLQTNTTINGTWGNFGSPIAGDGSSKTATVPVSGSELYFRAIAQ